MIVVRVELHSAVTGQVTELARAIIANTGEGTATVGNYKAWTLFGRDRVALDGAQRTNKMQRAGQVLKYPRQRLHVWHLVADALRGMGYGRDKGRLEE